MEKKKVRCLKISDGGNSGLIFTQDADQWSVAFDTLGLGDETNFQVGEKLEIEFLEMSRDEIENLREWDGF